MLGRFLELALIVEDPGAAWQRFQQCGFTAAETGDIWKHAYGVVACRGFALGLHARGTEDFSIVFVRPDVAALHRGLADSGVQIEQACLGADAFNELALREPGGRLIRVVEARSFSPPADLPDHTLFGAFSSLSLPCRNLNAAADFWRLMGYAVESTQDLWEGLKVPGTPLTYHSRRALPEPALLFHHSGALPELEASGVHRDFALTSLDEHEHSLLRTAEDLAVIVLAS